MGGVEVTGGAVRLSGKCEKYSCSMRAVKKVSVPFGKGESCQGSGTVVDHSKGCKIATRKV